MIFDKLEDVPATIKEFYTEYQTSTPTGVMLLREVEYKNESGEILRYMKEVPEYITEVHVKQRPRKDLKQEEDLDKAKVTGNYEHVIYCASKVYEMHRWLFHDQYILWLEGEPKEENYSSLGGYNNMTPNDPFIKDYKSWFANEPVYIGFSLDGFVDEYHCELAYNDSLEKADSPLTAGGKTWLVELQNRLEIKDAIDAASYSSVPINIHTWVMANNETLQVTTEELKAVIYQHYKRRTEIMARYREWLSGDRSTRFMA